MEKIKRFGTYYLYVLHVDKLIHNNKFKMNKGNKYIYTNELAFAMVLLILWFNQSA